MARFWRLIQRFPRPHGSIKWNERWFGIITQKGIRCGSFPKVGELIRKVNAFVEHDNGQAGPFVWVARAESILAKIERLGKYISGTIH